MRYTSTLLAILSTLTLTLAIPLSPPTLVTRQQLIPDLPPQLDTSDLEKQIASTIYHTTGRQNNYNEYGGKLQTIVPVAQVLDQTIGAEKVVEVDILADRLCIAGQYQGSLCNEILAYAYAWYVAQQKGMTYRQLAQTLGAKNVKTINNNLNTLCFGNENEQFKAELCQYTLEDVDVLANSLLGESSLSEDNNNSPSLAYFGLDKILPDPHPLGI